MGLLVRCSPCACRRLRICRDRLVSQPVRANAIDDGRHQGPALGILSGPGRRRCCAPTTSISYSSALTASSWRAVSGGHGRGAEAQGDFLSPRRSLSGRRTQARTLGVGGQRYAGGHGGAEQRVAGVCRCAGWHAQRRGHPRGEHGHIHDDLAHYVAVLKGTDVDQPRNLTNSVTVE